MRGNEQVLDEADVTVRAAIEQICGKYKPTVRSKRKRPLQLAASEKNPMPRDSVTDLVTSNAGTSTDAHNSHRPNENPDHNGGPNHSRLLFELVCNYPQQLACELFPAMSPRLLSMQVTPQARSQQEWR
jgi:hypothetical protein